MDIVTQQLSLFTGFCYDENYNLYVTVDRLFYSWRYFLMHTVCMQHNTSPLFYGFVSSDRQPQLRVPHPHQKADGYLTILSE